MNEGAYNIAIEMIDVNIILIIALSLLPVMLIS